MPKVVLKGHWRLLLILVTVEFLFTFCFQAQRLPSLLHTKSNCEILPTIIAECKSPSAYFLESIKVSETWDRCKGYPIDPDRDNLIRKWLTENHFFIATNQYNSELVLPHILFQIFDFLKIIGKGRHSSVFISVFENGSRDSTKAMLLNFKEILKLNNISHSVIIQGSFEEKEFIGPRARIKKLAVIRNKAIEPMFQLSKRPKFIFFVNDVYFCSRDIIELLYQAIIKDADIVSGIDLVKSPEAVELVHYDTWVTRDIEGSPFWVRWHLDYLALQDQEHLVQTIPPPEPGMLHGNLTTHAPSRERFFQNLPFQVSCTWGGGAVLNSAPFFHKPLGATFCGKEPVLAPQATTPGRTKMEISQNQMPTYLECDASECNILCKDFAFLGYKKFVIIPRVLTSYTDTDYDLVRDTFPVERPFDPRENNPIEYQSLPKMTFCIPLSRLTLAMKSFTKGKAPLGWEHFETNLTCYRKND